MAFAELSLSSSTPRRIWPGARCAACIVAAATLIIGGLLLVVLGAGVTVRLPGSGGGQLTFEWRHIGFVLIALGALVGPVTVLGTRAVHRQRAD